MTKCGPQMSAMDDCWFMLGTCRQWLQAVVVQGVRTIDRAGQFMNLAIRASAPPQDPDFVADCVRCLQTARDLQYMEEYFFVTAVHKAREWSKEAARVVPELASAVDAFCGATHHASDIRDMREHEIEYFRGNGRRQNRFVHSDSSGHVAADATASVINEGEYLIGNRLCVQRVVEAAERALPAIRKTQGSMSWPQP
jgi:hypothetical protein